MKSILAIHLGALLAGPKTIPRAPVLRPFSGIINGNDYVPKRGNIPEKKFKQSQVKKQGDQSSTTTSSEPSSDATTTTSTTSLWESEEEMIPEVPKSLEDNDV